LGSCTTEEDDQSSTTGIPEFVTQKLWIQIVDDGDTTYHVSIADFCTHKDDYLVITSITSGPAISIGADVEMGDTEKLLDNDDDNFFTLTYLDQAYLTKGGHSIQLKKDHLDSIIFHDTASATFTGTLVNNENESDQLEIFGRFQLLISL
jgi:hypothetical protein